MGKSLLLLRIHFKLFIFISKMEKINDTDLSINLKIYIIIFKVQIPLGTMKGCRISLFLG